MERAQADEARQRARRHGCCCERLAGRPRLAPAPARLTRAPGNDAPIGGLKVIAENGWFAARPSGTENIYKLYAESFRGPEHLQRIVTEALWRVTVWGAQDKADKARRLLAGKRAGGTGW